jgi:hypothetical protein
MGQDMGLKTMEREAYRAAWSDGIIDLYGGLSLLWMGGMWIWFTDLAGLAGIVPAVFVAPMLAARKRFVEPRIGYVEWRPARRRWERRNLWAVLAAGVGMFGAGVVLLIYRTGGGSEPALDIAPGILAWLLALFAVGIALLTSLGRLLLYAAILAIAGVVVVAAQANPGWALLAGGLVATVVGCVLLWRFVRRYPAVDAR